MTNNKSIDGLSTHNAKNLALHSSSAKKPTTKTINKTKAVKTTKNTPSRKTNRPTKNLQPKTQSQNFTSEITNLEINIISEDTISTTKTPHANNTPKTTHSQNSNPRTHEQAVADFLSPVQAFDFNTDSGELTESKDSIKNMKKSDNLNDSPELKTKKHKKEKKKPSKVRRTISIIALVIVLGLIGTVIWGVIHINDILAHFNNSNILDLFTFMDETYDPLKADENGRTNILAFGTEGYDMSGAVGNGTYDGAQLTDSIMLISLDQDTGDIAMISLPRDLKASPTCTATGKINEVYWCNNMDNDNEEAGATALMEEVGDILGVDIQYYAHLNWGSLTSIVDTLGGIEVTLDEDIEDYYYTGAVYEAGTTYTLDGEQALGLARARHGTSGGDFTRGASQQKIIIGIKNKVQEKDLTIPELLNLATILGDNLRTDFTMSELKTLAHLAADFDLESIRTISLYDPENDINYMTTATINGISYVIPSAGVGNYNAIQNYVDKMTSSDPRDYEDATIIILNSTDTVGLASNERTTLTEAGYTITDIGDTSGDFNDKYTLYVLSDKVSGTATLLEEYYNITAHSSDDLPADITKDYDIVIVIGADNTDSTATSN